MKKIFTAAAIALFMMTSCSDEDSSSNNNNNTDAVLLKKMIETDEDGSTVTTLYTYDGNKLMREDSSDGSYTKYSYTNGRLSGAKTYDEDGLLTGEDVFSYNTEGKLATYLDYWYPLEEGDQGWAERSVYTYNANGTVSVVTFTGDMDSQTEPWNDATTTLTNGNIMSVMADDASIIYTYDTKNSPFKNIVDYDITTLAFQDVDGIYDNSGRNNALTYILNDGDVTETRTYTYNSANYPVSATEHTVYNGVESNTTIQYFYE